MGAPICKAVAVNPAQIDQPCTSDTCVVGAVCVLESDIPFRVPPIAFCRKFCDSDLDCTNGGRCAFQLSGGTLKICSQKVTGCDPVARTGCPMGTGCYPVTPDGLTGCHLGGANSGGPCDSSYGCVAGAACIVAGGLPVCRTLCRPGQDATCAGIGFGICLGIQGYNGLGRCN